MIGGENFTDHVTDHLYGQNTGDSTDSINSVSGHGVGKIV